jgi:hypothetical protein
VLHGRAFEALYGVAEIFFTIVKTIFETIKENYNLFMGKY